MDYVTSHGARVPALGFGVFRMSDAEVEEIVPAALEVGFRHFDTAQIYDNEAALGRALHAAKVPREELFLTTKVWVNRYSPGDFANSVDESLERLGVDQVDLLLLHWPGHQVPIAEQIEMLNEMQSTGRTNFIGVSNQNRAQLRESVELSAAPILTNQVEIHPYLDQSALADTAQRLDVMLTAYFVMANGHIPNDPLMQRIGEAHGKTAAQVALRWALKLGHIVLTKTATKERLAENFDLFDFDLTPAEMREIGSLARPDGRIVEPKELAPDWSL
ncbi:aldo/keto reductase [Paracoccus jeotgali]|uniref:2,5-didehydrogluconate reductase n=1 Tax=Paracoccus jeotgali TaxID=2065379 RepID=A0A2K9MGF2_9RHOB|nr:aldo/keto reductase [Paracoccus jeotgali]AUM74731.1 2,5-didehydrogluconate reductase [Paracoccus jeotgali]